PDPDEGARLDVGKRRRNDAEHRDFVGQGYTLLVTLAARLDDDRRSVDTDDGADDTNGLLLRLHRYDHKRRSNSRTYQNPDHDLSPPRQNAKIGKDCRHHHIGGVSPSRP